MDPSDSLPFFAPLLALVEAATAPRDYDSPVLHEAIALGAQSARAAGVPPERVLAQLRAYLHGAPLADVNDWFRGVLVDHVVLRVIAAYYEVERVPG